MIHQSFCLFASSASAVPSLSASSFTLLIISCRLRVKRSVHTAVPGFSSCREERRRRGEQKASHGRRKRHRHAKRTHVLSHIHRSLTLSESVSFCPFCRCTCFPRDFSLSCFEAQEERHRSQSNISQHKPNPDTWTMDECV